MIREIETKADPETVAIDALAWLAGDDARLERFLMLTGTRPDRVRREARDPGFLRGVMQYVVGWEPLLVEFAAAAAMRPADVAGAAEMMGADASLAGF